MFQMAEIAIPCALFADSLRRINRLRTAIGAGMTPEAIE